MPGDIQSVTSTDGRLTAALVSASLAPSRTEAERLTKSGAVEIDGEIIKNPAHRLPAGEHTVRAGKKWVRVVVS